MKKTWYMVLVASMMLPTLVYSQVVYSQKKIPCYEIKAMISLLKNEFGEVPVFLSVDAQVPNKFFMTLNPITGSWTFVEHNDQMGCVLGSGSSSQLNTSVLKNLGI